MSKARQVEASGQQLALLHHVLDGVLREGLERLADLAAALVRRRGDRRGLQNLAAPGDRPVGAEDLAAAQGDLLAVAQLVEQPLSRRVDQADPRLHEQQRPHVRVLATRRRRAVDDRRHAARDEVLRRDAIEVAMVDDRDLPGAQTLDQVLGPLPQPGGADDLAWPAGRIRPAAPCRGDGHALSLRSNRRARRRHAALVHACVQRRRPPRRRACGRALRPPRPRRAARPSSARDRRRCPSRS